MNSELKERSNAMQAQLDEMEHQRKNDKALNEDMIKALIEARVKEMMKKPEINI